jgi:SAM-dependent methyltransferase
MQAFRLLDPRTLTLAANMAIDYDHAKNAHTISGPSAALPFIFEESMPDSLLDVGCGTGTWLRAAQELGIEDIFGVDGIAVEAEQLLISKSLFRLQDLTQPWSLGRRFGMAMCLEVAEHLDAKFGPILIDALVAHSDSIVFGAACPDQPGQHHVNCQWPAYWQSLFNERGFVCVDSVRWRMWNDERIESWYRQNIFLARRNPAAAGKEPRIVPAVHPATVRLVKDRAFSDAVTQIEQGGLPFSWYLRHAPRVMLTKIWKRSIKLISSSFSGA